MDDAPVYGGQRNLRIAFGSRKVILPVIVYVYRAPTEFAFS